MRRQSFGSLWSATAWIILIFSWLNPGANVYGIDLFWIVLAMWILRTPVLNMLFGPLPKRTQMQTGANGDIQMPLSNPDHPLCPSCGSVGMKNDKFCQDCGTVLEQPNTQYEGFN